MNRPRWIVWAIVASLGLLPGCQSSCGNGGGFLSGLTCRRGTVVYDGPVIATPVSSMPFGDCCQGGPMLGDPSIMQPVPAVSNGVVPPTATLPSPTPSTGPPPLAPVPGTTPPLATPVPAQPSYRRR